MSHLNSLPSVERILQTERAAALAESFGRPLTVRAIRETLEDLREHLRAHDDGSAPPIDAILGQTGNLLRQWTGADLRAVINATGVILHTNLGRAPLSRATILAMNEVARGYSNLELDLATGKKNWDFIAGAPLSASPAAAQGALVIGSQDGVLYCFGN